MTGHIGKRLAYLGLAVGLLFSTAAGADQDDPRLDRLFAVLQTTEDDERVRTAETLIWSIWIENEDAMVAALMQRGIVAMGRRQLRRALDIFDDMVEEAPEFAEGWNKRATVYYLMGNFEASVADVEVTLDLEPRHFGALSGLGQIELIRGDEPAALQAFEAALAVHPHLTGLRDTADALEEKLFGKDL